MTEREQFLKEHPFIGTLYRIYYDNNLPVGIRSVNSILKDYNDTEQCYYKPTVTRWRQVVHCSSYKEINETISNFPDMRMSKSQELYIFSKFHLISNEDQKVVDPNIEFLTKSVKLPCSAPQLDLFDAA